MVSSSFVPQHPRPAVGQRRPPPAERSTHQWVERFFEAANRLGERLANLRPGRKKGLWFETEEEDRNAAAGVFFAHFLKPGYIVLARSQHGIAPHFVLLARETAGGSWTGYAACAPRRRAAWVPMWPYEVAAHPVDACPRCLTAVLPPAPWAARSDVSFGLGLLDERRRARK